MFYYNTTKTKLLATNNKCVRGLVMGHLQSIEKKTENKNANSQSFTRKQAKITFL